MLDALRARLRNVFRRDAMEEELSQHLEESTQLLIRRGMPPDEARLAARPAMGNRTVIAEDAASFGNSHGRSSTLGDVW